MSENTWWYIDWNNKEETGKFFKAIELNDLEYVKNNYLIVKNKYDFSMMVYAITDSIEDNSYDVFDFLISKAGFEIEKSLVRKNIYQYLHTNDLRFLNRLVKSDFFIDIKQTILNIINDPIYIETKFKNYTYLLSVMKGK